MLTETLNMNNLQITSIIRTCSETSKIFKGVFASDTLPSVPETNSGYICNFDSSSLGGSHWICFFFPSSGKAEYFDSYGFQPPYAHFEEFLGNTFKYNPCMIQYPLSAVCGQYCIYFLWQRSLGVSMDTILDNFNTSCLLYNDLFVNRCIEEHFGVDLNVFDLSFVVNQSNRSFKQLFQNVL